jgi:hypothetical protein
MAIDMASVYAAKYRKNPNALRAAVMGQSPDASLDSYTALNALRLIKEADMMAMAGQAQQPTSAPSILAQNLAPPAPPQGLGAMIPMGAPAGQMPQQRAPMPQPTMQAASGGLAGMYTPDEDYAAGGIVAFDGGGLTVPPGTPFDENETGDYPEDTEMYGGGTDDQRALASRNVQQSRAELMGIEDEALSRNEDQDIRQKYMDFVNKNAGPNIYDPANKRLKEREDARGKNTSQGEGLALLAAAGAILEGNTLARGAAKAFPVFAQQMSEVKRADLAEQRSIESMQFSLADAQRKERMGDIRGAQAAAETARKEKADANRFKLNKAQALAKLDADVYRAANRTAGKGAGAQPTPFNVLFNAKQALAEDPKNPKLQAAVKNAEQSVAATKQSFSIGESGPNRLGAQQEALTSKENIEANKELAKYKLMNGREWKKSVEAAGGVEAAENMFKKKWITNNPQSVEGASPSAKPTAAPKPTATAPATKVVSMADIDATVAASGKTKQEVIDAIKAKGYTVK